METIKYINIDFSKKIYDTIIAKQNDRESRYIQFRMLDNQKAIDLTGITPRVYGLKPDGFEVFNDLVVNDPEGGLAILELTEQMLAVPGTLKLELNLFKDNARLSNIQFEVNIISSLTNAFSIVSTNEWQSLIAGLNRLDTWNNKFEDKYAGLEQEYASELTNSKNDIINLNSKIDNTENGINSKINSIAIIPDIISETLSGNIVLEKGKEYIVTSDITLEDNTTIDGRGATIKSDNNINLGNWNEIYNVNFETITKLTRDSNGVVVTNKAVFLNANDVVGINIHDCTGDGIVINLSNTERFIIDNNILNGGYASGGAIQGFNNTRNGSITNNTVTGCSTNGISLHTCCDINIEKNDCFNNGHSGIWTPYSKRLNIYKNTCHDHKTYDGIDVNFGADNFGIGFDSSSEIISNICYNNAATGIYLCGSNTKIENNICFNNGSNGIRVYKWRGNDTQVSKLNSIAGNTVYNNNKSNNPKGSSFNHNICVTDIVDSIIKDNIVYWDDITITTFESNMYLVGDNNSITDNTFINKLSENTATITIIGNKNIDFNNRKYYDPSNISSANTLGRLILDGELCEVLELLKIKSKEVAPGYSHCFNSNDTVKMTKQGDLYVSRSLQLGIADLNNAGTLAEGMFMFGYINDEFYMMVGTKNGNKKLLFI